MNASLHRMLALVVFLFSSATLTAPQTPPSSGSPNNPAETLTELHSLQDRILAFQDAETKIRTLILLADLLWTKPEHEPEARAIFQKTDEMIRSTRTTSLDATLTREKTDPNALPSPVSQSLKMLLVQRVSRHDPEWGLRLRREYELPPERKPIDSNAVSTQIQQSSVEAATNSLRQIMDQDLSGRLDLMVFMQLLIQLRAKDTSAADKLFVEMALKMASQPNPVANDLLIVGNYIFGSRFFIPQNAGPPRFMVSQIRLGDVSLLADVSQVRPNTSAPIARSYLSSATQILERPTYDDDEMKRRAAAAYLLIPHARTYAPELTSRLTTIVERSNANFYEPISTYSVPKDGSGKPDLNAINKAVEASPGTGKRDELILKIVRSLFFSNEFEAALSFSERFDDLKVRAQVKSVIAFTRAIQVLESESADRIDTARKNLDSLSSPLQRLLLSITIAQAYIKQGDKTLATTVLNQAIDESAKPGANDQQPYLILLAVEILCATDPPAAKYRMRDAIKAFNTIEAPRDTSSTFTEIVRLGNIYASFPLRISNFKNGNFTRTIKALSGDRQTLKATLFDLKNEKVLSEALIAYAAELLR